MAEANNPSRAPDNGQIGLPSIGPGVNKLPPGDKIGGKDDKPLGVKRDKDADILARARKRMDRCIEVESDNRKRGLEALKFKAGDQWPADVQAQRNADRRPCLTINKLPTFIHQVTNDQRQNRPSIDVLPVGDRSDKEAAKMYRGLIRAVERACSADIAYDTAFESAVSNGFGYWRINLEWEGSDSFYQVPVIKRIRNPFTVYLDPDHQEPDGADCRYGFVTEIIPLEEFKDQYPKATVMPYDQGGTGEKYKNWSTKDGIRVAEYYEIKTEMRDLVELSNGHIGWKDELHDIAHQQIKQRKLDVLRERKAECPRVHWYKLTALEIIDDKPWPGQWIPIVPVIGNEIDLEGKVRLTGLIDAAMDSQRMYNYWATMETEMVALAPKAPFIVEEGQIEGHEQQWENANVKSYPYLSYKGSSVNGTLAPPPQRQSPVQVPAGIVNARQSASMDMVATTGIRFDVTMDQRMVDESGRAIRELRRSGDLGAFHYVDNLIRALKHTGRQLVDLFPKIYDEKRVAVILREDGSEEMIEIDPHANQAIGEKSMGEDKPPRKVFNPSVGKYGVTIETGPSYATKRVEAAESMMAFAKAMPQTAHLIADLIAKNMDWEGSEEMAARLAKAVPPQLMGADQKDMSPQVAAMVQGLQNQIKEQGGHLQQAMAALQEKDKDRAIAQEKIARDFEAKILGIIQKAEAEENRQVGDNVKALAGKLEEFMQVLQNPPEQSGQDGETNGG